MSRSVQPTNYRRDPVPLSAVLAETFRHTGASTDLTAWVDENHECETGREINAEIVNEIAGQGILFCDEVNTEFTSTARPRG